MTAVANKLRKRLTFVRNRFYGKRANPVREPLKKGTGGINPCYRPSAEASKADLAEFHREDLRLRRTHQRSRVPNCGHLLSGSIATANRHTGKPHEHKREIARGEAS